MEPSTPEPQALLGAKDLEVINETAAGRDPRPARPLTEPPSSSQRPPIVRRPTVSFYRRMFLGKLYPLVVRLDDEAAKKMGASRGLAPVSSTSEDRLIVVQPVVPGALVTPDKAELSMQPGGEVRFWVLPMCRAKLPDARVELREAGRLAGKVPLRLRVGRRRWTWIMAFLTIVLPCAITYLKAHPAALRPPLPYYVGDALSKGHRERAPADRAANPDPSTEKPRTAAASPLKEGEPAAKDQEVKSAKPSGEATPAKPQEAAEKKKDEPADPKGEKPRQPAKPAGSFGIGVDGRPVPLDGPPPEEMPMVRLLSDSEAIQRYFAGRANTSVFFGAIVWMEPVPVRAYETLQEFLDLPFPAYFTAGTLLILTLIVGILEGPARAWRRGEAISVAGG